MPPGHHTIAHLSDLHCGSPFFVPELLENAITEINNLKPEVVVISGDLTAEGFVEEYRLAADYIAHFECENIVVIPGNHDSRNVGYLHFEDMFGKRNHVMHKGGISLVALDSTEPDLNNGRVGRGRYDWIREQFKHEADFRVFVLHHHLLPVPGAGRERSTVMDAGDVLEVLQEANVDLVLSGHKHVPYAWQLEGMFIVNAGTVSTTRLRGRGRPCYNIIEFAPELVTIDQRYPGEHRDRIISFSPLTRDFVKITRTDTSGAED
jgi:3',5'-cyclic AMP phosphodiesterase CpdA